VDVVRIQLQGLLVPLDRIVVALGIEVQVRQLDARFSAGLIAFGDAFERGNLGLIEDCRACLAAGGGVLSGLRRWSRYRRPLGSLLRAYHPAGYQSEENARDAVRDTVSFHEAER